ncbi:MAG: sugar ABC transporter substrate-binding protein, partial [Candidatus Latescibacteria bacterium]|nr:sugar ABC transporter substrate-binding protein [Candidatus Latescibacterota bacterium]
MRILTVLCVLAQAMAMVGCGPQSDGGVVLRIAWMGPELETYRVWKRGFESEHPNVTLEYLYIPYDQGPAVYNTMIEGGSLPDLGYVFMGMIPEFAERGALESLDGYLSEEDRSAWLETPLSASEYRGSLYGVPLVGATRTLYVRKDWMAEVGVKEAPNSWEGVRELAARLSDPPKRYGLCIGAGRQKHLMQEQISMMWGFGASFFDREGRLAINTPEAVAYVGFLTDMHRVDKSMPPGILNLNANECYAEMAAGKVGMVFSGPWQDGQCREAGVQCDPLLIPAGGNRGMLLIVDVLSMFATSKHKDLAYAFIRFAQRKENRTLIDVEVGGVPMTKAVSDDPYYRSAPVVNYLEQIDILRLTPKHPEWTKIQDGWGEAIQMVLAGTASPKEALDIVQQRLMKELVDPNLP